MTRLDLARPGRDASPRLSDYEQERATFRLDVPERYNPVLAIVESWAAESPGAPAVLSLDGRGEAVALQSAGELAEASRKAARGLQAGGIGKGDRVFVMLPRVPEWYAAMLGAMRIGAVPMPGPNLLTPKDIADRLQRGDARAAITNADGAAKVDQAGVLLAARWCVGAQPPGWAEFAGACEAAGDGATPQDPTHRDDPLLLYFTSGTVSKPKLVEHRQDYALGHVGTARFWHDLRPGDVHWTVTDTGWAKAAWGGLFGQFHERACVVQADLGKPDAGVILRLLADHGITSFCAPPTLYRLLVQADLRSYDLGALRHCTSAGEPLNPEVIRAWQAGTGGLTIYDGYGQTETTCLVANYRTLEVRPGSMGKPVPGWDVDVVDDRGGAVEAGEVGNVVVVHGGRRQIGLFPGYHGDAGATAAVFRGPHYFTGDRAAKDEEGYFWFEGRDDDVITSSAYRIGPFEVESAMVAHPAVTAGRRADRDRCGRLRAGAGRRRLGATGARDPGLREAGDRAVHVPARDPGLREAGDRAVQVPARDPLCGRAAEDGQRQDPARGVARVAGRRPAAARRRGVSVTRSAHIRHIIEHACRLLNRKTHGQGPSAGVRDHRQRVGDGRGDEVAARAAGCARHRDRPARRAGRDREGQLLRRPRDARGLRPLLAHGDRPGAVAVTGGGRAENGLVTGRVVFADGGYEATTRADDIW